MKPPCGSSDRVGCLILFSGDGVFQLVEVKSQDARNSEACWAYEHALEARRRRIVSGFDCRHGQPTRPSAALIKFDAQLGGCYHRNAGWSSLVARWAHNPKVGGSNPPPATNSTVWFQRVEPISQRTQRLYTLIPSRFFRNCLRTVLRNSFRGKLPRQPWVCCRPSPRGSLGRHSCGCLLESCWAVSSR